MESVIQTEKECYICGSWKGLHSHHIYPGAYRRKASEKRGFKVWLCYMHHSEVHQHINSGYSIQLKMLCQEYYEKYYGTREEFIAEFGRNYL